MDELLMRCGDARWCADCAAVTIYLPVPDSSVESWSCTACDAAVVLAWAEVPSAA